RNPTPRSGLPTSTTWCADPIEEQDRKSPRPIRGLFFAADENVDRAIPVEVQAPFRDRARLPRWHRLRIRETGETGRDRPWRGYVAAVREGNASFGDRRSGKRSS